MKTYLIYRRYYDDGSGQDRSYVVEVVESHSDLRVNEHIDHLLQKEKEEYALQEECDNFRREVRSRLSHERKSEMRYDHMDIPKWAPGMPQSAITTEMREERNSIKAHNEEIAAHNQKIREEIDLQVEKQCRIRFQELGLPEEDYDKYFGWYAFYFKDFDEISYYAEEVEIETL